MKKAIWFILIFALLFPSSAFAEDNSQANACTHLLSDKKIDEKIDDFYEYRASLPEKYTVDLIELLFNIFNLNTLSDLVFGNPYCNWFSGDEPTLAYGLFPSEVHTNIVEPMFQYLMSSYAIALCLAIMILGLRMSYNYIGTSKLNVGNELTMYLVAGVCMVCYWMGIELIFQINWAVVSGMGELVQSQGISITGSAMIAGADKFYFKDIILLFAEWILTLFLNLVYILRLFTITVLMMVGGLAIIGLLFEKTRKYFRYWLLALLGNIFMQSVHAIYFAMILLFISVGDLNFMFKLMLLILFLPMSSMMMNMLSLSDGLVNITSSQSMVNSGAALASFAQRRKIANKNKNASTNIGDIGKSKISFNASGEGSQAWEFGKQALSTTGAITGALAGSVIGGGGVVLGGMAGAKADSLLQAPRNVVGGIKGLTNTISEAKNQGLGNVLGNLQERRKYFGDIGESVGTMIGKGEFGRSMGNALSGVSNQRLLASQELGGLGGITLNELAQQYPGVLIQFQQTNEGSGLYMENDGTMQLISPMGFADPSLKDGEMRIIDYKLGDSPFEQNGDGQYGLVNNSLNRTWQQTSNPQIVDQAGHQYADNIFNADALNLDQFYQASMPNRESVSDYVANLISRNSQAAREGDS